MCIKCHAVRVRRRPVMTTAPQCKCPGERAWVRWGRAHAHFLLCGAGLAIWHGNLSGDDPERETDSRVTFPRRRCHALLRFHSTPRWGSRRRPAADKTRSGIIVPFQDVAKDFERRQTTRRPTGQSPNVFENLTRPCRRMPHALCYHDEAPSRTTRRPRRDGGIAHGRESSYSR
jgi:hypothetical protein